MDPFDAFQKSLLPSAHVLPRRVPPASKPTVERQPLAPLTAKEANGKRRQKARREQRDESDRAHALERFRGTPPPPSVVTLSHGEAFQEEKQQQQQQQQQQTRQRTKAPPPAMGMFSKAKRARNGFVASPAPRKKTTRRRAPPAFDDTAFFLKPVHSELPELDDAARSGSPDEPERRLQQAALQLARTVQDGVERLSASPGLHAVLSPRLEEEALLAALGDDDAWI